MTTPRTRCDDVDAMCSSLHRDLWRQQSPSGRAAGGRADETMSQSAEGQAYERGIVDSRGGGCRQGRTVVHRTGVDADPKRNKAASWIRSRRSRRQ